MQEKRTKVARNKIFILLGTLSVLLLSFGKVMAQNDIRTDVPLRVYSCSLTGSNKSIEKGNIINVQFIVENYRKQQSPVVEFNVHVPSGVSIMYGEGKHIIESMAYKTTQGILYKMKIKSDYTDDTIPIEVWMSDDKGTLTPCYQAIIRIGQTEKFAHVKPIVHSLLNNSSTPTISQHKNPKSSTTRYRVVNTPKLNVRQKPSPKARIVGVLSLGNHVEVDSIENGWACIIHKQQRAYISAKYIESDPIDEEIMKEKSEIMTQEPTQNTIAQIQADYIEVPSVNRSSNYLWFVTNLGIGFSNLSSSNAYSYGTFGMAAEVGLRYHWGFLPQNMFTDFTVGFSLLGNETYSFPYFSITLYPFEMAHRIFSKPLFGQVGLSLLLGGDNIIINRDSFHRNYAAQPCVALVLKESIELSHHWNVGIQFIRGLNNVCDNLPIGLYHSSIQVFTTYKCGIR